MPAGTITATPTHLGKDLARVQLRTALAEYFHAQPVAAPRGFHSWPSPHAYAGVLLEPPALPVGDPITLVVRSCPPPPNPSRTPPLSKKTNTQTPLKKNRRT